MWSAEHAWKRMKVRCHVLSHQTLSNHIKPIQPQTIQLLWSVDSSSHRLVCRQLELYILCGVWVTKLPKGECEVWRSLYFDTSCLLWTCLACILVYLYMCIVMFGLHCPATSEKRCTWYMNVSLAIQEMTVCLPVFVDWFPFAVELQQLWGSATEAAPDAKMDAADAKVDAAGSCLSRRFDDNFLHSDTGTQD